MRLPKDILKASEARGKGIRRPPAIAPPVPRVAVANRGGGAGGPGRRKPPPVGANVNLDPRRARHLEFGGARPTDTELERIIGDTNDLVDEFYLERALLAARPVCRLIVRDHSSRELGYATGFLIAPHLVLTNWHVFPSADEASNALAEFNYKFDVRGEPVPSASFRVRPDRFYLADRGLDFAVVAVDPQAHTGTGSLSTFGYHQLVSDPHKIRPGEWITIIQHPGGRRRQFAIRENQLIANDNPDFLWYASDTAQGSSGAPAFNDSFQIVALHHSGKARRDGRQYVLTDGRRVPSLDGIDDSAVDWEANEGLRVSALCRFLESGFPTGAFRDEYLEASSGGDILTRTLSESAALPAARDTPAAVTMRLPEAGNITIAHAVIHQLVVGAGAPSILGSAARPGGIGEPLIGSDAAFYERAVQPIVDPQYENRKGYVENLLGTRIPMPTVTKRSLVSRLEDDSFVLPYQHFSVVMHRTRRLALFTAANVTAFSRLKTPEAGKDYSRKGLGGFAENDTEMWITDPRIPEHHQLPDTFFTQDRQSFDKGHIVRREDVCWGTTYDEVRRANGDTFHTTNCSPQVKSFNRSNTGGVWGRLENYILKQAKGEAYSLFAGPVFSEDDEWFDGVDRRGRLRVQIPRAYWKVVVARGERGLEAFAFLMTQDLSGVVFEDEFGVNAGWAEHLVSVPDLQSRLDGIRFSSVIRGADQFNRLPF